MLITVSTPYRENSIVNIARAVEVQQQLHHFYTTLHLARWKVNAQRLPVIGKHLAAELSRRSFPGISSGRVFNVAILPEVAHVVTRRLLGNLYPAVATGCMYQVKELFDKAVAKHLNRESTQVLVGMYGSSLESFKVVKRQGGKAVLNFVNSHPADQNRHLYELANLQAPHHELIPAWVVRRVEAELELADQVLVPSCFVGDQLVSHGVSSNKIATIPYGVDLRIFHPSERNKLARHPLECLYVGQISHRKGIRILLEAAKRFRDLQVCFRLIGPIVSRELLDDLPENVHYEGIALPGNKVAEAMRQADIFVLPTIEDAFGLVVLEAMASALPVITTKNNGSSELIEDGKDGLIVPAGDADRLADAIGQLVEQPDLGLQLGMAARQKVQSAHSWEYYGKEVIAAITADRKKKS